MKKYFTYCLRTGMHLKREWYVEEYSTFNSLYPIHKAYGQVFETKEACEDKIQELIQTQGGSYLSVLPIIGMRKGTKKSANAKSLKGTYYRSRT